MCLGLHVLVSKTVFFKRLRQGKYGIAARLDFTIVIPLAQASRASVIISDDCKCANDIRVAIIVAWEGRSNARTENSQAMIKSYIK